MELNCKKFHKESSNHKEKLKKSQLCGCFYCRQTFQFTEIKEWVNKNDTALCPYCGIDSVLPLMAKNVGNIDILKAMNEYWFSAAQ